MWLNTVSKKDLTMKLFDLDVPQTKQSKKVLESYFGNSIDFAAMKPQAASDMLTKVRGLIYEHRTTRPVVKSENDTTYMKLIVMERGLSARLREASITLEPQTGATQIKLFDLIFFLICLAKIGVAKRLSTGMSKKP